MKTPLLVAACSLASLTLGLILGWQRGSKQTDAIWREARDGAVRPPRPGPPTFAIEGARAAGEETSSQAALRLFRAIQARGKRVPNFPALEDLEFEAAVSRADASALEEMLGVLGAQAPVKPAPSSNVAAQILVRYASLKPEAAVGQLALLGQRVTRTTRAAVLATAFSQMVADPARAQRLLESLPDANSRKEGEAGLLVARARTQPDVVLHELLGKASWEDHEVKVADDLIARRLADPTVQVPEFVASVPEGGRSHAARFATVQWLQKDPAAAADWARQTTNEGAWLAVAESVTGVDARQLSFTAGEMRERFGELTDVAGDYYTSLASCLAADMAAHSSPAEALEWAARLSPQARESAEIAAARAWINDDPAGASGWLQTLPAGERRDNLACDLVRKIVATDSEAATRWAASIESESIRAAAQKCIAERGPGGPRENDPFAY